jgi:hypothetical protein
VTKFFCATCGAHMLDRVDANQQEKWYIAIGVVDAEESVWNFTSHNFVKSTGDGGLAVMLRNIGKKEIGLWNERPAENAKPGDKGDWEPNEVTSGARGERDELLRVRCHCGAVELGITQPDATTERPQALVANDVSKWSGRHCACTACRLTSSSFIASFINIPISALRLADGGLVASNEDMRGMGTAYHSAKDVTRTFCGICGASVSYRREEEPGIVKITAGLIDGESARAEEWVEWIAELHESQDTVFTKVVEAYSSK